MSGTAGGTLRPPTAAGAASAHQLQQRVHLWGPGRQHPRQVARGVAHAAHHAPLALQGGWWARAAAAAGLVQVLAVQTPGVEQAAALPAGLPTVVMPAARLATVFLPPAGLEHGAVCWHGQAIAGGGEVEEARPWHHARCAARPLLCKGMLDVHLLVLPHQHKGGAVCSSGQRPVSWWADEWQAGPCAAAPLHTFMAWAAAAHAP